MSKKHKYYLQLKFDLYQFRFTRHGLTDEQLAIIMKFGSWLMALDEELIAPQTDAQRHFVSVCRGEEYATTDYEHIWLKYKRAVIAEEAEDRGRRIDDNESYQRINEVQREINEREERDEAVEEIGWLYDHLEELEKEQEKIVAERNKLYPPR